MIMDKNRCQQETAKHKLFLLSELISFVPYFLVFGSTHLKKNTQKNN